MWKNNALVTKVILSLFLIFTTSLSFAHDAEKEEKRELEPFKKIVVRGNLHIEVYQNDENSISIDSGEVKLDKIITEIKNNTLYIKIKNDVYTDKDVNIYVSSKNQVDIESRSGAKLYVDYEMTGEMIDLKVFAGAKIIATKVNAGNISMEINSGGEIQLQGNAKKVEQNVKTGGDILCQRLNVTDAVCRVFAGGNIYVKAKKKLDAKVTTGGNIVYYIEPEQLIEKIVMGGTIEKKK
jgi:hypothetical protein